jgi:hypothetical protein
MTIFTRTEHLSVEGVIVRSFRPKASLMLDAGGQALMKAFKMH